MLSYVVLSCAFGGLFYELGMFSSIPLLYPLAGKSNTLTHDKQMCVQTLPDVSCDGTEIISVEDH